MLKCPNPSCPFVFDPARVPAGVVLSCPQCTMQFTLGPPQATPPSGPTAAMSAPSFPTMPPAKGRGAPPSDPDFEEVGRKANEERDPDERLPARGTNKAQGYILAGIVAVLLAGAALAIFFKIKGKNTPAPTPTDSVTRYNDINIAMDPVPSGWVADDGLRVKLETPYVAAFKHDGTEAYAAFGAYTPRDNRAPRQRVMRNHLHRPFPKLFLMDQFREEPPVANEWLKASIGTSEPFTNGFKFRAPSPDGIVWMGEVYAVERFGLVYYWLSWCKESDYEEMKPAFAEFRTKFKTQDLRAKWEPKQANGVDYKGDKVGYTLTDSDPDPKDSWRELPERDIMALKEFEPDLDRRLEISAAPEWDTRALPDTAELSVFLLDAGGGDPAQTARKYAEDLEAARIKAGGADLAFTIKEVTADTPLQGDDVPSAGHSSTAVVRLVTTVPNAKAANRLTVVSGTRVGEKTVVVIAWCPLPKQRVFEKKLVQIASSLH
jgi:hypothetical protein